MRRGELAGDHLHDSVKLPPRRLEAPIELSLPGRLAAVQESGSTVTVMPDSPESV